MVHHLGVESSLRCKKREIEPTSIFPAIIIRPGCKSMQWGRGEGGGAGGVDLILRLLLLLLLAATQLSAFPWEAVALIFTATNQQKLFSHQPNQMMASHEENVQEKLQTTLRKVSRRGDDGTRQSCHQTLTTNSGNA